MNKKIKLVVTVIVMMLVGGCIEDKGRYSFSEFQRVHISELHKGYMIEGSGNYNGEFSYLHLFFKDKRYKYALPIGKVYEGDYIVDVQKDTVSLIGDEIDKEEKPIQGTFSINKGYIVMEKSLHIKGNNIDFKIEGIQSINSENSFVR